MAQNWRKLGIIAGGGDLPLRVAQAATSNGGQVRVIRLQGFCDPALEDFSGISVSIGEFGAACRDLHAQGCDAIVFAGTVARPDLSTLRIDEGGQAILPQVLQAMQAGDDALLKVFVRAFEEQGFRAFGAEDVALDLLAPLGALGALEPDEGAWADIRRAAEVAGLIGALDIGQGAIVCDGLVLAVEAQEGTDSMLARVAELPALLRGSATARRGVLVKRPKPQQERRIDLPTIGLRTVEGAARAGLAGIAVEAAGALVMDREALTRAADAYGLFVVGFDRNAFSGAS